MMNRNENLKELLRVLIRLLDWIIVLSYGFQLVNFLAEQREKINILARCFCYLSIALGIGGVTRASYIFENVPLFHLMLHLLLRILILGAIWHTHTLSI